MSGRKGRCSPLDNRNRMLKIQGGKNHLGLKFVIPIYLQTCISLRCGKPLLTEQWWVGEVRLRDHLWREGLRNCLGLLRSELRPKSSNLNLHQHFLGRNEKLDCVVRPLPQGSWLSMFWGWPKDLHLQEAFVWGAHFRNYCHRGKSHYVFWSGKRQAEIRETSRNPEEKTVNFPYPKTMVHFRCLYLSGDLSNFPLVKFFFLEFDLFFI